MGLTPSRFSRRNDPNPDFIVRRDTNRMNDNKEPPNVVHAYIRSGSSHRQFQSNLYAVPSWAVPVGTILEGAKQTNVQRSGHGGPPSRRTVPEP
jgi:hypothetical protein